MLSKTIRFSSLLSFVLATTFLFATGGNEDSSFPVQNIDRTIAEIIASEPNFDELHELLAKDPTLLTLLDEEGSWTIFVPSNTAFIDLNKKAKLFLRTQPMVLQKFLDWHVTKQLITPEHIKVLGICTIASYQYQFNLYADCDQHNAIKIRDIPAVAMIRAKNGMIYAFDKMMICPDVLNELNQGKIPARFDQD